MTKEKKTVICPDCEGNGFIRVPYEEAREELHANCSSCNNQGELCIETLLNAKKFLQEVCRRAGNEIKELKDSLSKVEKQVSLTTDDVLHRLRDPERRIEDETSNR